ncbi:MAG TPA: 16S rRNA (cytidine(1402)-2'-O)-methyltransferase [Gammaproteobacteria bacterium]|nr:16S rRNA (cytidine(1402)-2'-O)-methyltransferase [Gammaproteobacteria bacterium]
MQIPAGSVSIERPCLYLVATPIGHLADVGLRALAVLNDCDLVLAEDTRVTRRLLDHYAIAQRLQAVHEHNERALATRLVERIMREGLGVALVSDAGTPLVSDPGYPLLRAALDAGLTVRAVPGACAALAALCVSGLPSDRFAFEGFLPHKEAAARSALAALVAQPRTLVLYEAPRRVRRTLELIVELVEPAREICVARELTKLHETIYRGTVVEVLARLQADAYGATGEFVLVIAPAPPRLSEDAQVEALLHALAPHLPRSRAVEVAASVLARPRNEVYRLALAIDAFEA